MCGIVGFTGAAQAAPILLDGLAKLEYRGYDSAGMAVQNAAGKIEVVKAKGRLKVLSEMTDGGSAVPGSCGIGHTRWATHGEPSVVNAHPHYSRDQKIAVVHNGIIENYQELKERLINKGFSFVSQTDTEVVAQLLDYYYMGESAGNALDAITRMMLHVRGSYALGVLFADEPGVIYAVRKDSPLIVGKCEDGAIIASDVPALLKYTRTVYYIDNLEIARLTPDSIEFFNIDKEPITRESTTIEWDAEAAEKGGYEHFMMKEIYEQPASRFVANFIGKANFIDGIFKGRDGEAALVEIGGKTFSIPAPGKMEGVEVGGACCLTVRPESFLLTKDAGALPGTVSRATYYGAKIEYEVMLNEQPIIVEVYNPQLTERFSVGDAVTMSLIEGCVRVLK